MTSGTERRARSTHLTIRLTPDEKASVDTAAERAGLTSGSYARQTLLGAPAPRQVRRPSVERKELAKLLGQLGSVRGLLNQLAKQANQGLVVNPEELELGLTGLRLVRDRLLKALGREP